MSDPQRTWANIGLRDAIKVQPFDPFSQGGQPYLGSADVEVSFASVKKRVEAPYDQDELSHAVIKVCRDHSSLNKRFLLNMCTEFRESIAGPRPKDFDGP